jgi:carbon starvation protein
LYKKIWLPAWFDLDRNTLTILPAVYGFIASVLLVWLPLAPRDYLSSFMKLGVVLLLAAGVLTVPPNLNMPPVTKFIHGDGSIIPGTLFPFVFITIACGAISGFHSLISSGTTPKMIEKESYARPIGYGAMLMESFVGVMALIAATVLIPGDYFAINTNLAVSLIEALGFPVKHIMVFKINALLTSVMLVLSIIILIDSLLKWYGYLVKNRPNTTTEVVVYSSLGTTSS